VITLQNENSIYPLSPICSKLYWTGSPGITNPKGGD